MNTKVYIDDKLAEKWKELAMKRFGYGRGSISKAAEEALSMWVEKEQIVTTAFEKLKEAAIGEKNILALLLFGSYARKEPYHDIDIAIVIESNADKLKVLSIIESSVPEEPRFDFSIFNDMPMNMKSRVLNECIVIYNRKDYDLKEVSSDIIIKWSDIKPIIDSALV
ncbi:nucleotidyltransferase [Candidatus Mancarchaeum acidiphilum]|uniref:Nucleotidyltransferase n=1 Tax=Candidatus Mancarchaeum acidiphilum TaxID=1920749 RepID=A0A218NNA0_9ARCH|nr:nucleotidyltransferase domain-containing protein [Candidatus Mancarchaeum acidiphilum]ASI13923.1 nucleotidyltransferase [Candidatus Mancarchaeum acidiphilum]ASI13926.1 nucleotidyltransferase [Candidatus Mancarchaeum acidiphilum]ASI13929.1 nucleotidyltransferase [Candidatus Mancarchaeum acidiphilum]ASI13932.1 nucleotidyltransferase [Candidatus Mancarchaeum acidiphilum]